MTRSHRVDVANGVTEGGRGWATKTRPTKNRPKWWAVEDSSHPTENKALAWDILA